MDVRTACLGVLSRGEATGYEIRKLFEEGPYSHFYDAGFGSIYPALARLCEDGLATVREVDEPGRPTKKLYSITPAGRAAFLSALMQPPAPDRRRSEWIFMAYFAELLPPELMRARMDERIAWYRGELTEMAACDTADLAPGQKFVLGLGQAIYQAAADYIEAEKSTLLPDIGADAAE